MENKQQKDVDEIQQMQLENFIKFDKNPEEIFEILEQLGQGNYGKVYKARNRETNQIVAIKELPVA